MSKSLLGRLLVASAACAIAACGGGGGTSAGLVSTPPPPPPPATKTCPDGSVIPVDQTCPPPPPPPKSPEIFAGITTNTDFAVLGLEAKGLNTTTNNLARDNFSVRYDATTQRYLIDLPSVPEFGFISRGEDASFWYDLAGGFYSGTYVDVFKPRSTNPEIQLAYTSFGVTTGYYSAEFGFFAFGSATPSANVPVTGSASYNALIAGRALDTFGEIDGDATFQFNFGAGTLSGHFDPVLHHDGVVTDLGTYNFINTVFGVGSATFSGALSHVDTTSLGAFDGRFTGPAAQELMARWTAPYRNPSTQQWNEMFGVMVGKKQ